MVESPISWCGVADDALFAAIAAIGFSTISHTPRRACFICGLAAAVGHSLRFILLHSGAAGLNIVTASLLAALAVGCVAVASSPLIKVPAEACLFPALLPMIPGMYAYRAIGGLVGCIMHSGAESIGSSMHALGYNMLMCMAVVLCMVIGGNLPVYIFKKISFQATR